MLLNRVFPLTRNRFSHVACLVLLCCLAVIRVNAQAAPYASVSADGRAAVASVNPLATKVGMDILAKGGNAVDAAIAVAFALGVVDSHNSGIGGGCFILVRTSKGEILAIDGREMAPAAAHRDMYLKNGEYRAELSKTGALAVGVPGSVKALYELQQRAGTLSFANLIQPSIPLAEHGFAVDAVLAARLQRTAGALAQFPDSAKIFLPDGKPLKQGQMLVQKDLARTYSALAKQGPTYFYRGQFAKSLVKWMEGHGGLITRKDMRDYHLVMREPLRSAIGDYELVGFPPPSSGGIHVAQILTMLNVVKAPELNEVARYHAIIEASKLAFADRAYWLGDADYVKVPRGLIDDAYLRQRAALIDINKASGEQSAGLPPNHETEIFGKHTTHIATADKAGNWVAITTTLNTSFGSKVTVPGTGVLLNNQMDDFSAQPGAPNAFGLVGSERNAIAAGKRPLSSMSPTLVLKNGAPVMTVGAAGGPTIISQVAQTLFNALYLGMPLQEAMRAPRVHHQWKPQQGFIDDFAEPALREELKKLGHDLRVWPAFGATQAILLNAKGSLEAEAEPRIQTAK